MSGYERAWGVRFLARQDRDALLNGTLATAHPRYHDHLALGMIERPGRGGIGLQLAAERTRKAFALEGPEPLESFALLAR